MQFMDGTEDVAQHTMDFVGPQEQTNLVNRLFYELQPQPGFGNLQAC